jgi:cardiolipin synthase
MSLIAEAPPRRAPSEAGVSRGLNLAPGANDDGWLVTDTVQLEDGNAVRLYKDGEGLRAAYESLQSAKRSIFIEFYTLADDHTGRAFAELLMQKAESGIKVYLIYDSFGSLGAERRMFRQMRRAGVRIRKFHPLWPWECTFSWRPFNRDHRKLVIVDGEHVSMGGLNVANEYAGPWISGEANCPEFWRDCTISLSGPVARHFIQGFVQTWQYLGHGGRIARALYSHNLSLTSGPVGMVASVPTMDSPLAMSLRRLITGARSSIDLTTAYFAPGDDFVNELCDASSRGVKVRLMLPSKTDVPIMVTAARSFYERLLQCGVEIYERQYVVLHAKTLLVDGNVSVLGSTNLDYRSIEYNCELATFIRSDAFGQHMRAMFENDKSYARPVHDLEWRRRPRLDRVIQWAVNRSRYLL